MIFSQDDINSSDTEEEEESDNDYNSEEEEVDDNEINDEEEEGEGNNDDNEVEEERNNDEEERNGEEEEIHQIIEALDKDEIPSCDEVLYRSADLPQGNDLAGVMRHNANKACWVHVAKTMRTVFNREFTSDSYEELQQCLEEEFSILPKVFNKLKIMMTQKLFHRFKTELFLSYVDMKFEAALMNVSTSWYKLASYTFEEESDWFEDTGAEHSLKFVMFCLFSKINFSLLKYYTCLNTLRHQHKDRSPKKRIRQKNYF
ncbi:hypothetical protein GLOIN_2v1848961 [Rhizophagus clarus]|uniref:Uncharacterized protein n=1 Tax=Rhizophagus clarus TaxID=94130 RepID=A0A8H3QE99_9GLOM|nr:hypothetical protein GLOIN_2v1848961 [Rhizophagus clarus]